MFQDYNWTALSFAMEAKHNDILEYLLLKTMRVDVAQIDNPDTVNNIALQQKACKSRILLLYSLGIPSLILPKYGTLMLFHCS